MRNAWSSPLGLLMFANLAVVAKSFTPLGMKLVGLAREKAEGMVTGNSIKVALGSTDDQWRGEGVEGGGGTGGEGEEGEGE